MKFTQLTLQSEQLVKKPNNAEEVTLIEFVVPARKDRLYQSRIDDYSMQGLQHVNRYIVSHLGEFSDVVFSSFLDEKGNRYRILSFSESIKNNEWIIEGVRADGI